MPCSNCRSSGCSCSVVGTELIQVTGTGEPTSPYTVSLAPRTRPATGFNNVIDRDSFSVPINGGAGRTWVWDTSQYKAQSGWTLILARMTWRLATQLPAGAAPGVFLRLASALTGSVASDFTDAGTWIDADMPASGSVNYTTTGLVYIGSMDNTDSIDLAVVANGGGAPTDGSLSVDVDLITLAIRAVSPGSPQAATTFPAPTVT